MGSSSDKCFVARRRELKVGAAGPLRLLFEAVKDVDGFFEFGDVDDTERSRLIVNTNLRNTGTDAWHRFPVIWLLPVLEQTELVARCSAREDRKGYQSFI
jgi:hypothetical protein